jgi:hypothetical protein
LNLPVHCPLKAKKHKPYTNLFKTVFSFVVGTGKKYYYFTNLFKSGKFVIMNEEYFYEYDYQ